MNWFGHKGKDRQGRQCTQPFLFSRIQPFSKVRNSYLKGFVATNWVSKTMKAQYLVWFRCRSHRYALVVVSSLLITWLYQTIFVTSSLLVCKLHKSCFGAFSHKCNTMWFIIFFLSANEETKTPTRLSLLLL